MFDFLIELFAILIAILFLFFLLPLSARLGTLIGRSLRVFFESRFFVVFCQWLFVF